MGDALLRFLLILLLFFGAAEAKRGAGPYVGGGYGISALKDGGYYDLKERNSNGYVIYAGAYINEYLSVEIEHAGSLSYTKRNDTQSEFSFSDINTQAHYPLYDGDFDLYAKFGAGYVTQGGSGHTLVYGGGAAYRINERYAVRVGYDYFDFGIDNTGDGAVDKKIALEYLFCSFEVQF